MNLFRSEEHVRNWKGYQESAAAGLQPLSAIAAIWGADRYRQRLNGHYVSSAKDYLLQVAEITARVTGGSPFWKR